MIQEQEVRDKIADYLQRGLSLDVFSEWLGVRSWNMHRDSSLAARRLVGSVELVLAEHSGGYRSVAEVRQSLATLLQHAVHFDVQTDSSSVVHYGLSDTGEAFWSASALTTFSGMLVRVA